MKSTNPVGVRLDRPTNRPLRLAFGTAWLIDLVATVFLFVVPYASELNPITRLFYDAFGLAGVLLAGSVYAAAVVLTGHLLSKPADGVFVAGTASVYAVCATNNVVLLLAREPIVENLVL